MANFNITINSQVVPSFYVEAEPVISTDCSSYFEYVIYATNLDDIDISLVGDHESEAYVLNGVETPFTDSVTGIVYNTSLRVHFILQNSGAPGVFPETTLTITNNTEVDSYVDSVQRINDEPKCGADANFQVGADNGVDVNLNLGDLFDIIGTAPFQTTVSKADTTISLSVNAVVPDNEILFGTGTGIESSPSLTWTGTGLLSLGTIASTGNLFGANLILSSANPDIVGNDVDGDLSIYASTASLSGGEIKLYGESHATKANDIEFLSNGIIKGNWDNSANLWTLTGNLTVTGNTNTANLELSASNPFIIGNDVDGVLSITPDISILAGSGFKLYGSTHLTKANDIEFTSDNSVIGSWDNSVNLWSFVGNVQGTSFIKTGGLSTQFLKADGSVDSNSYALASAIQDWLRADVADVKTSGTLSFDENVRLRFGDPTSGMDMYHTGTNMFIESNVGGVFLDLHAGDFTVRDDVSTRFTFGRTTGDFTNTGTITSQGTGDSSFVGNLVIGATSSNQKFEVYETDTTLGAGIGAFKFSAVSNYVTSKNLFYHRQDVNQIVINEDGVDLDFRVEGDTDVNLFKVDAGTDRVGIGIATPLYKLDVTGTVRVTDDLFLQADIVQLGTQGQMDIDPYSNIRLGRTTNHSNFALNILRGDNSTTINHKLTGVGDSYLAANNGNVGIGTTSPQTAKLHLRVSNTAFGWTPYVGTSFLTERNGDNIVSIVGSITGTCEIWFGDTDTQAMGRVRYENSTDIMSFWTAAGQKAQISSAGNVSIGNTNNTYKLDVTGKIRSKELLLDLTDVGTINVGTQTNGYINFGNGSGVNLAPTISGKSTNASGLSIQAGTNNGNTAGDIIFNVRESDNSDFATLTSKAFVWSRFATELANLTRNGNLTTIGTMTATNFILSSDERLKTFISPIQQNKINVNWKEFELKEDLGQKRYGVIAQELEVNHPEFVRTNEEGIKSVAYIDLLVAKIAELEQRLEKAGI